MSKKRKVSSAQHFSEVSLSVHDRIMAGERMLFYTTCEPGYGAHGEIVAFRITMVGWDGRVIEQFDINPDDRAKYKNGW